MVKLGLGESYDKTLINKKIRAYIDVGKPASSLPVTLTIICASIMYAELNGMDGIGFVLNNWTDVIYASITAFLLHSASQSLNMAEDAHIDRQTEHKQNRPIPSGVITEEEARSLAWIFMFVGIARAFTITPEYGLFAIVLAFMGVFYNLDPIRAKKKLWVNLIWQAVSRGLLLYPAAFAVWGDATNPVAWGMGVVAFLLVLSLQNSADLPDTEMDEKYDIITPAVYYGAIPLIQIMAGISLLMFIVLGIFIYLNIVPNFWLVYLLSVPIALSLIKLYRNPQETSDISGQSAVWYAYYGSLASLYILPATQLILF